MGTHPIFESDFDCPTECGFPLSLKDFHLRSFPALGVMGSQSDDS